MRPKKRGLRCGLRRVVPQRRVGPCISSRSLNRLISDFVAWGGVQATMEEEARDRAEQLVTAAAGSIFDEMGVRPAITVKPGEAIDVVKVMLEEHPGIAALVLGAAAQGAPGPLIAHFTGINAGTLPCPVMVIPGSLSDAQLDELS